MHFFFDSGDFQFTFIRHIVHFHEKNVDKKTTTKTRHYSRELMFSLLSVKEEEEENRNKSKATGINTTSFG